MREDNVCIGCCSSLRCQSSTNNRSTGSSRAFVSAAGRTRTHVCKPECAAAKYQQGNHHQPDKLQMPLQASFCQINRKHGQQASSIEAQLTGNMQTGGFCKACQFNNQGKRF